MNFAALEDEINLIVDEVSSEVRVRIPGLINEAILYIANEPGIILPALKSVTTVTTIVDQAYTAISDIDTFYESKLIFASIAGVPINPHNSLDDLLYEYGTLDEYGDLEAVALEGQTLWYAKIPTVATDMLLLLYLKPTVLVDSTDECTEIPSHLHRDTIVRWCAYQIFDLIEQGVGDQKTNTMVQKTFYDKGITKLREYLASRRRGMSRSIWNV